MLLATDLAEALVRAAFRSAKRTRSVGTLVAHCVARPLDLRTLTHDELRASIRASEAGADELLALERALEERSMVGATARARVVEALDEAERALDAEAAALAREEETRVTRSPLVVAACLLTLAVAACGRYGPRCALRDPLPPPRLRLLLTPDPAANGSTDEPPARPDARRASVFEGVFTALVTPFRDGASTSGR